MAWACELVCELVRELVCELVRWVCVWELTCVGIDAGVAVGDNWRRGCGCWRGSWQVGVSLDWLVGAVGSVGVSAGILASRLHLC